MTPPQDTLRACWHPVAYSHAVTTAPTATTLLGEPLVLWRASPGGPVAALRDVCIHRGTALSLGEVCEGQVVCPYHGWRFGEDGRCTWIPQLPDPTKVPRKARVPAYACQEALGMVWVALDAPRWPLPVVPELDGAPGWAVVPTGPFAWRCDASRQVENFTDLGHFPFVHPGLLGDPDRTEVPAHTVTRDGHVLRYDVVRPEAPNSDDFPVFANPTQETPERTSRYALHLPYTIVLRLGWSGTERGMIYVFASQPVGPERCVGYCLIARNYNLEQPPEVLQEFEEVIFGQDQRIVESQRPEQVPVDLRDELHLSFDAVAVAYRRALRDLFEV